VRFNPRFLAPVLLCLGLLASCSATPAPASPPLGSSPPTTGSGAPPPGDAPAPGQTQEQPWEKIREEDGILVYRREIEGSPLVAFRGEGEIEAPIALVALVEMDLSHNSEWIDSLVEGRLLEARSESEYFAYSHIKGPPLISDRDFVNHIKVDFKAPDSITFNLQASEHPASPNDGHVRGQLIHSSFHLTAVTPTRTKLVCEIQADPKGSLPKWVVNFFQKGWAYKTIMALRKQVTKPGIVERAPQQRDVLKHQGFPL
jgi:hypothetical protein